MEAWGTDSTPLLRTATTTSMVTRNCVNQSIVTGVLSASVAMNLYEITRSSRILMKPQIAGSAKKGHPAQIRSRGP